MAMTLSNSKQACPYLHSLRSLAQMSNARMHWKHPDGRKDSSAQAAATRITTCLRQENTRTSNASAAGCRHL